MGLDRERKVRLLAEGAGFDVASPTSPHASPCSPAHPDDPERWIYPTVLPGGRIVRLFKVLLTNVCENNCLYCANRRETDCPRATFGPDELARAFTDLTSRGRASGLFLSSALAGGGTATMARMLAAVEIVRRRYGFRGYVHLKILPGAERAAVERALQLADRVSINLEAPNAERLRTLSAEKEFAALEERLHWAAELRRERGGSPAGITTQFVVGASGDSDAEILATTGRLYQEYALARAYFSAFRPLNGTPLEHLPPTPSARESRLYQADFLIRAYGFAPEEMVLGQDRNLPLDADPKLAWARAHPEFFPIDLGTADRHHLLRVPGIGPRGADKIVAARKEVTLRSDDQIRALGISLRRAAPFILVGGRRLEGASEVRQLTLW